MVSVISALARRPTFGTTHHIKKKNVIISHSSIVTCPPLVDSSFQSHTVQ